LGLPAAVQALNLSSMNIHTRLSLACVLVSALFAGCASSDSGKYSKSEVHSSGNPDSYPTPAEPLPNTAPQSGAAASSSKPVIYDYSGPTQKVGDKPAASASASGAAAKPHETGPYTVVSGDSLWKIARKHGITVEALKQANNLTSDALKPGQVLQIP